MHNGFLAGVRGVPAITCQTVQDPLRRLPQFDPPPIGWFPSDLGNDWTATDLSGSTASPGPIAAISESNAFLTPPQQQPSAPLTYVVLGAIPLSPRHDRSWFDLLFRPPVHRRANLSGRFDQLLPTANWVAHVPRHSRCEIRPCWPTKPVVTQRDVVALLPSSQ